VGTGIASTTTTDAKGYYSVTNLQPGTYDVTTVATGFSTIVRSGIVLTVAAKQQLNISLAIGQVKETVTVAGTTPTVQLANSSISGVVDQHAVETLPLNGRDWTLLAALQPGVNTIATQQPVSSNGTRGNRGYGNEITVSGTRPQENNYLIDGISLMDYAGSGPGNVGGYALGVDAISEFSTITANSSAEYGHTAGGIVNAVTRSGTNQFHGEAFGFLRSASLDAPGFFDSGVVPPFHRNQFGGTLGGPIRKDKTFFMIDYEGFRQGQGTSSVNNVPALTARRGLLFFPNGAFPTTSNPATNCVPTGVANQCQVQIDPVVAQYLNFWPTPSASAPVLGDGNTAQITQTNNNVVHENFITGRMDNHFSDRDSLSGTYLYQNGFNNQPDPLNTVIFGNHSTEDMLSLQETHVFSSSFTNTARIGFNRVTAASTYTVSAINPLAAQPGLGAFGRQAATIFAGSLTPFNGGINGATTLYDFWNSYQAGDDAFLVKGNQSVKIGFSVERDQHNNSIDNTGNGQFNFGSLYDFLTNQPNIFTGSPSGYTKQGLRQTILGLYVQDDWKIASRLTLNLGLRYEMATVPTSANNHLVNLRVPTASTPTLGSPLFSNPTLKDFEPRLGFAWDPFGTGNTAVRGAFGMFDVLPLTDEFFVMEEQSAPYTLLVTKSANPSLPQGSFPAGFNNATASASDLQSAWIQPNPKRDYVMIWNLDVQRQITPSISAMIGYVGNHEVHAYNRVDDYNTVIPTLTPVGVLFPSPAGSGTILNPNVGSIRAGYWTGSSVYNALQASVTKTLSRGLQAEASYTWGKNIDTGSATDIGDPFRNSISSPYPFWPGRRGLSDFNIAQSFVMNFMWNVPVPKHWEAGVLGHALSGWQMNGIFTAQTGLPFTAVITPDPVGANSGDPWAFPDVIPGCKTTNPGKINYLNLGCFTLPTAPASMAAQCSPNSWPGATAPPPSGQVYCQNLLGNERRNSIIGPSFYNLDFSIFKNNRISENLNIQMRAEFFNVMNHASFLAPINNQALFDSSGAPNGGAGRLDQLQVPAREIQFGLRVIF
jgi:outer membrane receptor protein involved in Fe transport